jgi:hypothetical protein
VNIQHAQQHGTGGSDALHGRTCGVDWRITEQGQRGGCGNGQCSVLATDRAATGVQVGCEPAIDFELSGAGGGTDDVDDGVDCADFVKVHRFDGD